MHYERNGTLDSQLAFLYKLFAILGIVLVSANSPEQNKFGIEYLVHYAQCVCAPYIY